MIDLIGTIGLGGKEQQGKDVLGRVYEYFLSQFASAEGKKGGEFYTPRCVVKLLVERGGPAAIHLAESEDEARFLCDGGGSWSGFLERRGLGHVAFDPPGVSPVRYLEQLGALHPRLVAAHCVKVDEQDRARLARHGVQVVLCPRSNRNLGVGRADVPALLASGVRLALGASRGKRDAP